MATVMTTTLPLALAAPLALASVVVADAVTVGIHVAGTIGSRRRAISMMGSGAITDAITRAAVVADAVAVGIHVTGAVAAIARTAIITNPIAIGIHVAGTVATIARTIVVADAVTVSIHVTPPGDGLRGRVRCHDSLSRGQVSHAKRKSRNGKDGAQSRCHNRDHFPLH